MLINRRLMSKREIQTFKFQVSFLKITVKYVCDRDYANSFCSVVRKILFKVGNLLIYY